MPDDVKYLDGDFPSIKIFSKQNPTWSESSIRWLRFNEEKNGAAKAAVFVEHCGRVLIDRHKFFKWVSNGGKAA